VDGLRARAEAGDLRAAVFLVELLAGRGEVDEAVQVLWARAAAGDWQAAVRLVELLASSGSASASCRRACALPPHRPRR
jgi:hypothetical protein